MGRSESGWSLAGLLVPHAVNQGLDIPRMAQHQESVQLDSLGYFLANRGGDSLLIMARDRDMDPLAKDPVACLGTEPPGRLEPCLSELCGEVAGHEDLPGQPREKDQASTRGQGVAGL